MGKRNLTNLLLVIAVMLMLTLLGFSVRLEASPDTVTVLNAAGITCEGCVNGISRALKSEGGVSSVAVDAATGRVVVGHDAKAVNPETLTARAAGAGYACRVLRSLPVAAYRREAGDDAVPRQGRGCCCSLPGRGAHNNAKE